MDWMFGKSENQEIENKEPEEEEIKVENKKQ